MNRTPGGNEYAVHVVNLPCSVLAAVAATDSDTYHVFINDRLSPAARQTALDHEIRHIDGDHLYCDVLPVGYLEQMANNQLEPSASPEWKTCVDLDAAPRAIPYFPSLESLKGSD